MNTAADEFLQVVISGIAADSYSADDPFAPEFALPDAVYARTVIELVAESILGFGRTGYLR